MGKSIMLTMSLSEISFYEFFEDVIDQMVSIPWELTFSGHIKDILAVWSGEMEVYGPSGKNCFFF